MDAKTKTYVVTDRAGPFVAGLRVNPGDELELTENEARTELLEGAIVEKGRKLAKAFDAVTPRLEKTQTAAAAAPEPAAPEGASKPA